jgi:hypothetical protein
VLHERLRVDRRGHGLRATLLCAAALAVAGIGSCNDTRTPPDIVPAAPAAQCRVFCAVDERIVLDSSPSAGASLLLPSPPAVEGGKLTGGKWTGWSLEATATSNWISDIDDVFDPHDPHVATDDEMFRVQVERFEEGGVKPPGAGAPLGVLGDIIASRQDASGRWFSLGDISDNRARPPFNDRYRQVSATAVNDELHVCGVQRDGEILHSSRVRPPDADAYPNSADMRSWENLEAVAGERGTFRDIACAATADPSSPEGPQIMQVVGVTDDGRLWHALGSGWSGPGRGAAFTRWSQFGDGGRADRWPAGGISRKRRRCRTARGRPGRHRGDSRNRGRSQRSQAPPDHSIAVREVVSRERSDRGRTDHDSLCEASTALRGRHRDLPARCAGRSLAPRGGRHSGRTCGCRRDATDVHDHLPRRGGLGQLSAHQPVGTTSMGGRRHRGRCRRRPYGGSG